jgi:AraC family transcriptional regulator
MLFRKLQPVLKFAAEHLNQDVSLAVLARETRLSPFHLQRVFSAVAGETPKKFTLRLRLDLAAGMLLANRDSVLDIALACGFQSNEVFSRAFKRRFGINPARYRKRGFAGGIDAEQTARHIDVVTHSGPCIGLYHLGLHHHREDLSSGEEMEYSITKREIAPQPVLAVRRRVKPDAMAAALAEIFGEIFVFAQSTGTALAGQPLTRFIEWGPGLITIDGCLPVATPFTGEPSGNVRADTLPGGKVAMMLHTGPYDKLVGAHAAVQRWIEEQGLVAGGAPWETYITDPTEYPDPKDWKTEIFWPLDG